MGNVGEVWAVVYYDNDDGSLEVLGTATSFAVAKKNLAEDRMLGPSRWYPHDNDSFICYDHGDTYLISKVSVVD